MLLCWADLISVRWRENYFCYSCEWVCWRSVFTNAYSERLHKESVFELFFIDQVNRNHSNSIGLASSQIYCCISGNAQSCALSHSSVLSWQVPGDELKWVRCCTNDDLVAMASLNGMVILCSSDIVSLQNFLGFVCSPNRFVLFNFIYQRTWTWHANCWE